MELLPNDAAMQQLGSFCKLGLFFGSLPRSINLCRSIWLLEAHTWSFGLIPRDKLDASALLPRFEKNNPMQSSRDAYASS